MATKSKKPKFTAAQIKEQIKRIQSEIEKQKKIAKKDSIFIAPTPEEIEEKLKRVNSPIFYFANWIATVGLGGTFQYRVGIFNPDPTPVSWLYVHVWFGSGNIDRNIGTFLLNVDTRFPRLTEPDALGFTLAPSTAIQVTFNITIPTTVEKTMYIGNSCLMKLDMLDIGTYYDRGSFGITVI
jgi:hypothetical protein